MTFYDWLSQTRTQISNNGREGVYESLYELHLGLFRRFERFADEGTNVFEREWDALVILDGCRVDAMSEVANDYEFLDTPDTHRSNGSTSYQWMDRTFTEERTTDTGRTAHVTANPFSDDYCSSKDWALLDEVWRYGWDDDAGIVPAETVTDRAIHAARNESTEFDRLLVHYMQPHFPSVPEPLGSGARLADWRDGREMAWQGLRRGQFTEEEVWNAYIANLRYVLDEVAVLLENLDANRVILSADHGNAKGEWGIYGHPNVPLDVLREVPWYVTSATDEHTYVPDLDDGPQTESETTVEDRLKALGYHEGD